MASSFAVSGSWQQCARPACRQHEATGCHGGGGGGGGGGGHGALQYQPVTGQVLLSQRYLVWRMAWSRLSSSLQVAGAVSRLGVMLHPSAAHKLTAMHRRLYSVEAAALQLPYLVM